MNFYIVSIFFVQFLAFFVCGKTIISIKYPNDDTATGNFGQRSTSIHRQSVLNQAKQDLSLSYSATNIDSKEGTRVKTLTVIKNVGKASNNKEAGGSANQEKLALNPDLNKNDEWTTVFRENFESIGLLPDVPDIDELFEFVNKKKTSERGEATTPSINRPKVPEIPKETPKENKEPVPEVTTKKTILETGQTDGDASVDIDAGEDDGPVEKIKGEAEFLPHTKQKKVLRLQSLGNSTKRQHTRESLINVNYSTPLHSVHQYYDNYVQAAPPNGYDYPKPCPCPPASIPVTTPSGRKYDIPVSNSSGTSGGNPYLAPAITRRPQTVVNIPQNLPAQPIQPNYLSVNSVLPPLQQQPPQQAQLPNQFGTLPSVPVAQTPTPTPAQPTQLIPVPSTTTLPPLQATAVTGVQSPPAKPSGGSVASFSTSQRPYVAPNLRNGLGISRGPPPTPIYSNAVVVPNYRTNVFVGNANKPNAFRSRGLKY